MYSGLVYRMLGIPDDLFTPLFAIARISGWCAHRIEEVLSCSKIIRPAYRAAFEQAEYVPMAKPDKNATGTSNAIPVSEMFKLSDTLTPGCKTYGLIYNTGETNSVSTAKNAKDYMDKNGLSYKEAVVTSSSEVQQAAQKLSGEVDAFFIPNDSMVQSAMPQLAEAAKDAKKPIYGSSAAMWTREGRCARQPPSTSGSIKTFLAASPRNTTRLCTSASARNFPRATRAPASRRRAFRTYMSKNGMNFTRSSHSIIFSQ